MKRSWLWLAFGLVLAVIAMGCSGDRATVVRAAAAAPLPAAAPAPKLVRSEGFQASGPLVVENQLDLAAQREGVVAKILADVGTRVRKGQLLAELDNRQLMAQHDAATAKALAAAEDAKNWRTQIQLVATDLARDEEMYKYKLITQQQLEHARFRLEGAKQQAEREAQTTKEAQQQAKAMALELEKTRILAPFDGVVARRYVRVGQRVTLNDRLFWVTATEPLNVKFTLPQEFVNRVRVGDVVQVSVAFEKGEEHAAKVTLVSPVVDPPSGTVELQAQVVGPPKELRPGMTVNINVKPQ